MRKIFIATAFGACLLVATGIPSSYAGEIDLLLNKLVEKGVLTAGEAQELKTETNEQVKAEIAQGKSASLPAWVQNTKLKGDFRLRYQMDKNKNSRNAQNRGRIRLRLGLDSKVNDKLNVGVGLATGKDDGSASQDKDFARSTNQTLSGGFSKHPIALDYAYAQYLVAPYATIVAGKFKNALWEPGDLIWDTDINPEGGAIQLAKNLNSKVNVFMNTGAYTLNEISASNDDPMMYFVQPGVNLNLTEKVSLKGAVAYNMTRNMKGETVSTIVPGYVSTNTQSGGTYKFGYNYLSPAAELTFREPFKGLNIPFLNFPAVTLFGEYVNNTHPSAKSRDTGYMAGMKVGAEKIANWGDWQLSYNYAMLGKDAIMDILPDSDRYGGKTGMRAHEGIFQYGLGKNTYLSVDYYYAWAMHVATNAAKAPTHLVQVDWNLKF